MDVREVFREYLRLQLQSRGLSQHDLERRTGIKFSTINTIINGRRVLRWNHLQSLIDGLGINLEEAFKAMARIAREQKQ